MLGFLTWVVLLQKRKRESERVRGEDGGSSRSTYGLCSVTGTCVSRSSELLSCIPSAHASLQLEIRCSSLIGLVPRTCHAELFSWTARLTTCTSATASSKMAIALHVVNLSHHAKGWRRVSLKGIHRTALSQAQDRLSDSVNTEQSQNMPYFSFAACTVRLVTRRHGAPLVPR